jgi:hypothetical protein
VRSGSKVVQGAVYREPTPVSFPEAGGQDAWMGF